MKNFMTRGVQTGIKAFFLSSVLGVSAALLPALAQPAMADSVAMGGEDSLMGYWLSQDHDGVFKIEKCGETVCGRLIGLRYDGTDVPKGHDGKTECNLLMLTDFRPLKDEKNKWEGNILDPDSGHKYDARIWSPQSGVLKLRGYLGLPIFGETQTWTRYSGPPMGPVCKMP
ncbi:hypothetical protein WSS15_05510 [Acetobacter pasteurianus]|uniref:DUF2147 domain-containing protein n=3 Tax=Acetobacter pasteurianus TaxID=438 RepID=C7JGR3_ACEP3|nr:DUF2147 domain-containing protein [Acetobacter pasteurianus]ASC04381.1 hypothetical protein S101468_00109 [Acetobacter pasteurianus subsp. pasteurianus]BAH99272.1 hypothetical protein APA01_11240 [Acetobacter pasteurianus IFO 3283-01]BAI02325.1 hypothetical protein APA03_11240 [Acetobacter pasteurianus IFO 3283-03]BAI05371.1 hypothetical protein APA07_11240 [Acetobacter pasteurianus IFO 3283-07]BAI08420.1 hypothetical protein APA22_11240 [Acetobacter pasteurianus IFO 3283-22]